MLIALILFSSCKKAGTQLDLQDGKFTSPALRSLQNIDHLVLTTTTENSPVLKFQWSPADFGPTPVISYTLQLDKLSDTTDGHHWENAVNLIIDKNTLEYEFTGKYLNNVISGLGLLGGMAHDIVFRVKADLNQNNGSTSTIASAYSNALWISVTTYETNLYVPGDYQGWNPASAPIIAPVSGSPGKYEGYVNITGTGVQYFKFTNAPDWNHTNYGDGGGGTFSTDGAAGGLSVPEPGYYELTANLNNNTWTATKTTWGIIGDATPGGWGSDTQMSYDAASQVWIVTADMVQNGSFKFRANGAWSIDFGIDAASDIQYADNPFFAYNPNLNNLTVPADGNYTITLDLHTSQNYTYILHKN